MARRFTLELIMDLASQIGANPAKAVSRSNISFLGKGPTKNPLFQNRLAGLENATKENLGKPETLFGAIEDAVGWAKDGKLNSIQTEILGHNLSGINKILNPPPLPMATVMRLPKQETGIASVLPKQGKVEEVFFGNPKDPRFYKSPTVDDRGRTWDFKSRLQEPGPGDIEALNRALNQKTGMSRAIARQILQQDTRLKLPEEVLISLRTGSRGPDPLDLMKKYYGRSMENFDDFLNNFPNIKYPAPKQIAARVLNEVELVPQFAEGGLAGILEV